MTGIYLEELVIDGYRSCAKTTLTLHKSLSALIGINGAGKTNILNAIRLLNPAREHRFRRPLEEITHPKTTLTATFRVGGKKVRLRQILTLSSSRIQDEVTTSAEVWNLSDFNKSQTWVELPPHIFLEDPKSKNFYDHEFIFYEHTRSTSQNAKRRLEYLNTLLSNQAVVSAVRSIQRFRTQITYYSASLFTDPTRCPSSFELDGEGQLDIPYSNRMSQPHIRFLFDLYKLKTTNSDLYNEFDELVSTKQLGLISRLSWKAVKLSSNTVEVKSGGTLKKVRQYKTLVIPKIQIGSSHITFNQLSEGTFKTLAMIFYIMTDRSSCLLIEEPEVCIHYGLLRRILSTIKAYSKAKQVVFSTHSDLVLDEMEIENVFVVEMKKSQTSVNDLTTWAGGKGMLALNAYLEEAGTLGEYWRSGGLSS